MSMITSRLDYSNATFVGVVDELIMCVRKIQNNAVCVACLKKVEV